MLSIHRVLAVMNIFIIWVMYIFGEGVESTFVLGSKCIIRALRRYVGRFERTRLNLPPIKHRTKQFMILDLT